MQTRGISNGRCLFCSLKLDTRISVSSQPKRHTSNRKTSLRAKGGNKSWQVALSSKERQQSADGHSLLSLGLSKTRSLERHRSSSGTKVFGSYTRVTLNVENFLSTVLASLQQMQKRLDEPGFLVTTGIPRDKATDQFEQFSGMLKSSFAQYPGPGLRWTPPRIYGTLRQAYERDGAKGIETQLLFALQAHVANRGLSQLDILNQARLADLRYPYEWFSRTRTIQREIHLHIGPTNSGKTYHALKKLEQADTGVYAGPLRLLAHEVYSRLNAKGKHCNLITGDEIVMTTKQKAGLSSCTVEMVPCGTIMDVAVIDEIQMIEHNERGWAWTQALLGVQAKEVHLCGEERALPIIKELATAMGERLHIHRYERLSPLRTMSTSLDGKLQRLRKGDCLVVFSRREIHELKTEIERLTKKKVAVVYGSLPPETRAQQARLFNDQNNEYDILVASDAIGMGLNLSIKRIVFEATQKYSGGSFGRLSPMEIKQIAGRAGRYRVAVESPNNPVINDGPEIANGGVFGAIRSDSQNGNLGLVTTLEKIDLPLIQRAMIAQPSPIATAGILPPDKTIKRFADYFPPSTPLSYILLRLQEISRMHARFHFCRMGESIAIADTIQHIKGLNISDRLIISVAPVNLSEPGMPEIVVALAECVEKQSGALLDIKQLNLELLDQLDSGSLPDLQEIELLHKALTLYIWLSYRFSGIFVSQAVAFHIKGVLETRINESLAGLSIDNKARERKKKMREMAILLDFEDGFASGSANTAAPLRGAAKPIHRYEDVYNKDNSDESVVPVTQTQDSSIGGPKITNFLDHISSESSADLSTLNASNL